MTVGECLTYVYDREALATHRQAWQDASRQNQSVRLPAVPPAAPTVGAGQDLAVVCKAVGGQRYAVTGEVEGGRGVVTVVVGAVTVRVPQPRGAALLLLAWTRAEALAGILDDPED